MGMYGGDTVVQSTPPPAPEYKETSRDILQAQIDLAPQLFAVEQQYQPQYQALQDRVQAQAAKSQLDLYGQLQPAYSNLEEQYNAATQAAQTRALQLRASPYVQAFQQAQGTAGITQGLQRYAEEKIAGLRANGGFLSPEEQRMLDQESRAAFAARGTALGQQSSLAEVLNRYNYRQAREQQLFQTGIGLGTYLQQQSAPAMASFYQQPMYSATAGGNTVQNALMSQQQAGPQYFNPESQVGMGAIYGAYNSQMQYQAGMAQAQAAANAGRNSMFGSIGGGLLMGAGLAFCWVAREVYGEANPKWLSFRKWMIMDAPSWLFNAYVKYGKQVASFIKDKPLVKRALRFWMDSKIKH